ncbi:hypothetical protein ID866_5518 [Astraeus odoratus]|nr:hypothetical protein ID866_5518 [Astraeus odoratus]
MARAVERSKSAFSSRPIGGGEEYQWVKSLGRCLWDEDQKEEQDETPESYPVSFAFSSVIVDGGKDARTTKQKMNPLHEMQLRAFLSAADDVDADSDTLEDLMNGVDEEVCSSMTDQDSVSESSDTEDFSNNVFDGAISGDPGESNMVLIDDAELRALEEEAEQAWSEDEIRRMMVFLKERGMNAFIKEYVVVQNIPIVKLLFAFGIPLCPELRAKSTKTLLYFLRVAISRVLRHREKLPQHNTIEDAVALIQKSCRIIILTGAGISVSCGIPDFRSRNGLYASLKESGQYDLDDPQQMFDIHYFKEHPAGEKRTFRPLKELSSKRDEGTSWPLTLFRFLIPCSTLFWAYTQPDITFFGEKLNDEFDRALLKDRDRVDLLLVIGTSLKVSPVSEILCSPPPSFGASGKVHTEGFGLHTNDYSQILINKTPIRHINPDIVLLGNADDIVQYLCERLHWELPPPTPPKEPYLDAPPIMSKNGKRSSTEMIGRAEPERVGRSHVWLFQGAEGGKWLDDINEKYSCSDEISPQRTPHLEPGAKKARVT